LGKGKKMTNFTKNRFQKLAGLLKEDVSAQDQLTGGMMPGFDLQQNFETNIPQMPEMDTTKDMLLDYPAWLRAIHLWFHAAHHSTKGTGFAGDHADLYDRIYTEVQDEVDGAVEKIVGLFDDPGLACPLDLTTRALDILKRYESPVKLEPDIIAKVGQQIIKDYLLYLENSFMHLERSGKLTLGLNDQISSSANNHETYVYLLGQRSKTGF
jgi:hypothetical protein